MDKKQKLIVKMILKDTNNKITTIIGEDGEIVKVGPSDCDFSYAQISFMGVDKERTKELTSQKWVDFSFWTYPAFVKDRREEFLKWCEIRNVKECEKKELSGIFEDEDDHFLFFKDETFLKIGYES